MVSAEERDVTRVSDLEQQEQLKNLHRVVAAVDEVPHEDLSRLDIREREHDQRTGIKNIESKSEKNAR